jgi:hypothetical protein
MLGPVEQVDQDIGRVKPPVGSIGYYINPILISLEFNGVRFTEPQYCPPILLPCNKNFLCCRIRGRSAAMREDVMSKLAIVMATGIVVLATGFAATGFGRGVERPQVSEETTARMPSFAELHANAHVDNLPIQEVMTPF